MSHGRIQEPEINVLIVEDDLATATALVRLLSIHGIRAVVVSSVNDVVYHLTTTRYDVVIIDYSVGGLNWIEGVVNPPLGWILHSGQRNFSVRDQAMRTAPCSYCT